MFLVMAIEHFPDSEPVTTLEVREREDDAVMLARCMRDEAKSAGRQAWLSVYALCSDVKIRTFNVPARRQTKRGCRR